jgi:hypothetical protein
LKETEESKAFVAPNALSSTMNELYEDSASLDETFSNLVSKLEKWQESI